jgi:hypothetical protein
MAAVATNPDLLAPVRRRFKQSLAQLAEATGLPRSRVAAITLAADAMVLLSVLKLSYLTKAERRSVMEELIRLATPPD